MRRGLLLLLPLLAMTSLGACATALNDGSTGPGDGAVKSDSTGGGDTAVLDGTGSDARDSSLIFETEGDAPRPDTSGDTAKADVLADSSPAPDTAVVDVGTDAVTRCGTSTPKILIYGPVGTHEQPYVPAGAVVTVAADATWRAMSATEFGSYNLIIIGEQGAGPGLGGTVWQAAFDTRATWNAAVTGRVVVTTLDPVAHTPGTAGGPIFLRAALSWAASGPGTGLYVGPDYGNRKLDFMSGFGTWAALGQASPDNVFGDDMHIVAPSHGTMVGSTDSSLSAWSYSYHGSITTFPASFVSVATSKSISSRHVVVARDVPCPP
jgi:hypothetical protein